MSLYDENKVKSEMDEEELYLEETDDNLSATVRSESMLIDVMSERQTSPIDVKMRDCHEVRPTLITKNLTRSKDEFSHKIFSLDTIPLTEVLNKDNLNNLESCTGIVKSALRAFSTGRNIIFSSDDIASKTTFITHSQNSYNLSQKPVIIVVRNIDVARRRLIELSNEFISFSMLPAIGPVFTRSTCYVATVDSFRMQVLRQPDTWTQGLVIFEDVEEISLSSKGYIWDDAFMSLPQGCQYVFLLPFVKNAEVLAEWLVHTIGQSVDVLVHSLKTALIRHFVCIEGSDTIMEVFDDKSKLYPENFSKIAPGLESAEERRKKNEKDKYRNLYANEKAFVRILRTLFSSGKLPILVFSTNRHEVEALANTVKTINFASTEDIHRLNARLEAEWDTVPVADKNFDRLNDLKVFLQRGIAVYHSGMTPLILEIIDGLLKHRLVKVVISDWTILEKTNHRFQTLILNDARIIIDPSSTTWICGNQYRQLISRLDVSNGKSGISVVIVSNDMTTADGKAIYFAPPPSIQPVYVLTFNSVLNFTRRHGNHSINVPGYTFYKYCMDKKICEARSELTSLDYDLQQIDITTELKDYDKIQKKIEKLEAEIAEKMYTKEHIENFINVGRLIHVKFEGKDFGWGIIAFRRASCAANVLVRVTKDSAKICDRKYYKPFDSAKPQDVTLVAVSIAYDEIWKLSSGFLSIPQDLRNRGAKECVLRHLETVIKNFCGRVPETTPVHLSIEDRSIVELYGKKMHAVETLEFHRQSVKDLLPRLELQQNLQSQINALQTVVDGGAFYKIKTEWQLRLKCLQGCEYINADGSLTARGAFASQLLGVADVVLIVLVELILSNYFDHLRRDECAMVFSVFILMEVTTPFSVIKYVEDRHKTLYNSLCKKIESGLLLLEKRGWSSLDVNEIMAQVNPTMFPILGNLITRSQSFTRASCDNADAFLFEGYYAVYIQRIDRLIAQVIKYGVEYQLVGEESVKLFQDTRKDLHRGLSTVNQLGSIITDLY